MMGLYFVIFAFAIAILSTFIPCSSSQAFSDDHIDLDLRLGLPSSSNLNTESTNITDHFSTLPHKSVDDVQIFDKEQNKKRKAIDTAKKSSCKKIKQLTPKELEVERTKNRLKARKRRQDIKSRGAKAIEEEKKKTDVYTQNWKARLIQDPARLQHHRKTSGVISEEDENWLSSVILDSPERTQNPSQPENIHTNPSTENDQQPASTTKKRKKSNKRTAEGLERRKWQARMNKKRKKEQSAESLEAFKARQREYSKKHFLKIRKDPLKNEKFKERHRIAAQKNYMKKKEQDPKGLAEYVRKKNQRFRNKKKLQKKTKDIN